VKKQLACVSALLTLAALGGCSHSQLSQAEIANAKPLAGRTVGLAAGDSLGMTVARDRQIIALRARQSGEPVFANVDGHQVPINPGE